MRRIDNDTRTVRRKPIQNTQWCVYILGVALGVVLGRSLRCSGDTSVNFCWVIQRCFPKKSGLLVIASGQHYNPKAAFASPKATIIPTPMLTMQTLHLEHNILAAT